MTTRAKVSGIIIWGYTWSIQSLLLSQGQRRASPFQISIMDEKRKRKLVVKFSDSWSERAERWINVSPQFTWKRPKMLSISICSAPISVTYIDFSPCDEMASNSWGRSTTLRSWTIAPEYGTKLIMLWYRRKHAFDAFYERLARTCIAFVI